MAASTEATSVAAPAQQPQTQLAQMAGRFRDVATGIFKDKKPWTEVFDRSAFARPPDLQTALQRIRKNALYFRLNYSLVFVAIMLVAVALNPTSLIALAACGCAWIYLFVVRQSPVVIAGRTFSDREKLIGLSAVTVIVVFFLTSVGTLLFTALGISVVLIAMHGAFRVPDDLFTDDVEAQAGLLSFFQAPPPTGANIV